MDIDLVSDVLRAVRMTGAIFLDMEAHAPWATEVPEIQQFSDGSALFLRDLDGMRIELGYYS